MPRSVASSPSVLDARGMGVRMKMIPGMRAYNGTEPDLVAERNQIW